MTEQEAHDEFDTAKATFEATKERLRKDGLGGRKLYSHPDYVRTGKAKWAAFDVWTKTIAEGK